MLLTWLDMDLTTRDLLISSFMRDVLFDPFNCDLKIGFTL